MGASVCIYMFSLFTHTHTHTHTDTHTDTHTHTHTRTEYTGDGYMGAYEAGLFNYVIKFNDVNPKYN